MFKYRPGQLVGQCGSDPLLPVFRQHVNPDLPHLRAVRGASRQADQFPAVIRADAQHVQLFPAAAQSVAPLRQVQVCKILRMQFPRFIRAENFRAEDSLKIRQVKAVHPGNPRVCLLQDPVQFINALWFKAPVMLGHAVDKGFHLRDQVSAAGCDNIGTIGKQRADIRIGQVPARVCRWPGFNHNIRFPAEIFRRAGTVNSGLPHCGVQDLLLCHTYPSHLLFYQRIFSSISRTSAVRPSASSAENRLFTGLSISRTAATFPS